MLFSEHCNLLCISYASLAVLLHVTQVIWLILVAYSCEEKPKFHIYYHLRPAGLKTLSNWDCSCCLGDQVATSLCVLVLIWNITFFIRGLYSSCCCLLCHLPCDLCGNIPAHALEDTMHVELVFQVAGLAKCETPDLTIHMDK